MYIERELDTFIDIYCIYMRGSILLSKWNTEKAELKSKLDQNELSLEKHLHNIFTITL
jgi:hypothetical protein